MGISEDLPLDGPRTLYGATKLAAELLIAEYVRRSGFGPWSIAAVSSPARGRWARSTRASCAYWLLAHMFRRPLTYIGFGGSGKQVRDLLHVDDLIDLVDVQLVAARLLDRRRRERRRRPGVLRSRCSSSRSCAPRSPGRRRQGLGHAGAIGQETSRGTSRTARG